MKAISQANANALAHRSVEELRIALQLADKQLLEMRNQRKEIRQKYQQIEAMKEAIIAALPEKYRPRRGRPSDD